MLGSAHAKRPSVADFDPSILPDKSVTVALTTVPAHQRFDLDGCSFVVYRGRRWSRGKCAAQRTPPIRPRPNPLRSGSFLRAQWMATRRSLRTGSPVPKTLL